MLKSDTPVFQDGNFEAVLSIEDYFDEPRSGIAQFHGSPHRFRCVFDELKDEYSNLYRLAPLSEYDAALGIEEWKTFLQWRRAFDRGEVSTGSQPVPSRGYGSNMRRLEEADIKGNFIAVGEFVPIKGAGIVDVNTSWKVKWSDFEGA